MRPLHINFQPAVRRHPPRGGLAKIGDPYSVDTRILPPHLSNKESLLLLSQWIRILHDDLHITLMLLDPKSLLEAKPTTRSNKRSHRLWRSLRHRPLYFLLRRGAGDSAIAGGQLSSIRCVSPDTDPAWWNSCEVQKPTSLDSSTNKSYDRIGYPPPYPPPKR